MPALIAWNGTNAFLYAPVLVTKLLGWHGTGVGALSKQVLVPLCRAAGKKSQKKKKKEKAPCWPEIVSLLSRLIQFTFGSGWERGCWILLERHICSLATGSKEANQMEGLRRASPGSQVSTPDCFQQISPPAPRKAFQRQKPPPCCHSSPPPPRPCRCQGLRCGVLFTFGGV